MTEYMVNFRGYAYIWAETEGEAEKIFRRRFRKAGVNGELERIDTDEYQDNEDEQLWKK